jgi:hypothetical protein
MDYLTNVKDFDSDYIIYAIKAYLNSEVFRRIPTLKRQIDGKVSIINKDGGYEVIIEIKGDDLIKQYEFDRRQENFLSGTKRKLVEMVNDFVDEYVFIYGGFKESVRIGTEKYRKI